VVKTRVFLHLGKTNNKRLIAKPCFHGGFVQNSGTSFVGRAFDNDIRIEDKTVSRKHLKIARRGNKYFITDLKNRNGPFLGEAPLELKQRSSPGA